MSYPPPNPDQYALNGYKFFRLNTPLTSDGDMYESQQGAQGFAIGPDSDISKVNIGYFDEQVPRFLNQVAITPERAFPGFIAARNEVNYVPANRPGRILIWSDELYNPTWSPSFIEIGGRIDFEVPVMDVVQYFAPAAQSMNQGRNDKEYWYDFLNAPAVPTDDARNTWVLVIPFYGRRFCNLNFKTDETVQLTDINVSVTGLHYKPGTNETAATEMPLINLDGGGGRPFVTVTPGMTLSAVILASNKSTGSAKWQGNNPTTAVLQVASGMYDALAFAFTSVANNGIKRTAQNTLRIRTSDRENG